MIQKKALTQDIFTIKIQYRPLSIETTYLHLEKNYISDVKPPIAEKILFQGTWSMDVLKVKLIPSQDKDILYGLTNQNS